MVCFAVVHNPNFLTGFTLQTFLQALLVGRGSKIVDVGRNSFLGKQTINNCVGMSCFDERLFG
jgi:hypothetical protein